MHPTEQLHPPHSPACPFERWPRAFDDLRREHGFKNMRVRGKLPSDLAGTIYYNGPGRFGRAGERSPFWLDGDGALSAIRITAAGAQAAVRMVRTRSYQAEERAGRRLYSRFERRSPRHIQEYLLGDARNPGNTSVWQLQRSFYALCAAGSPVRFDPDDLSTLGEHQFTSVGGRALSAHASYSAKRRAFYNFALTPGRTPTLELFKFPDAGGDRKLTSLPLDGLRFIHDFMVTDRHAVFVGGTALLHRTAAHAAWAAHACAVLSVPRRAARRVDRRRTRCTTRTDADRDRPVSGAAFRERVRMRR